jgi:hypothetical protein
MSTRYRKASLVGITALAMLAVMSGGALAGSFGYMYSPGVPAGLFPSRPIAGLYSPGQGGLYNSGQPGPTACGLSRCLYGGSPAGLYKSRRPW